MWDCRECQRLEGDCNRAIEEIRVVVRGRFNSVREKILALHEAQDVRDSLVRLLRKHTESHRTRKRSVSREESTLNTLSDEGRKQA
jgi:hypothetical protein